MATKPQIKCSPEVDLELGDREEVDETVFRPQVKLLAWRNECNLSIRFAGGSGPVTVVETLGESHVWKRGLYRVRINQVSRDTNEKERRQNQADMVVIMSRKPPTNVLNFTVRSKNIEAILQPHGTITDAELEELLGFTDIAYDDNIINSYMIQATGGRRNNKYKAGKIAHIYRKSATDANDATVWCHQVLDLEGQSLTVTIPQGFLDTATYPVRVD